MTRETAHHGLRCPARATEADQLVAEQDDPPDVAILAIFRVIEAETALPPEPTILLAAQAHPGGMRGLIQPLHARGLACVTANQGRALRRCARSGEREEGDDAHNH